VALPVLSEIDTPGWYQPKLPRHYATRRTSLLAPPASRSYPRTSSRVTMPNARTSANFSRWSSAMGGYSILPRRQRLTSPVRISQCWKSPLWQTPHVTGSHGCGLGKLAEGTRAI